MFGSPLGVALLFLFLLLPAATVLGHFVEFCNYLCSDYSLIISCYFVTQSHFRQVAPILDL